MTPALGPRWGRGLERAAELGWPPCGRDLPLDLLFSFGVDAEETALAAGADDEDFLLPRPILGRAPSVAASSAASLECFLSASPAHGDGDISLRGDRFRHGQRWTAGPGRNRGPS